MLLWWRALRLLALLLLLLQILLLELQGLLVDQTLTWFARVQVLLDLA